MQPVVPVDGDFLASLDHLGVLHFSGDDAETFLQGQLTCDVARTRAARCIPGAYCSPKGRMLANFLLWRDEPGFAMALARDVLGAVHRRLSMFVLRSKVKIADLTASTALLGFAGPTADEAARLALARLPQSGGEAVPAGSGVTAIRLLDGRLMVVATSGAAAALRDTIGSRLAIADARIWRWLDIRHGLPLVTLPTQDQLIPQMANLEILGGVSFDKGCYTGQEIIARTQHLGRVKRRMFVANVGAPAVAGDAVYTEELGDQASGLVVNAEPSPEGGYDALAVVQTDSRGRSPMHLKSLGGPLLRFLEIPYPIA